MEIVKKIKFKTFSMYKLKNPIYISFLNTKYSIHKFGDALRPPGASHFEEKYSISISIPYNEIKKIKEIEKQLNNIMGSGFSLKQQQNLFKNITKKVVFIGKEIIKREPQQFQIWLEFFIWVEMFLLLLVVSGAATPPSGSASRSFEKGKKTISTELVSASVDGCFNPNKPIGCSWAKKHGAEKQNYYKFEYYFD